MKLELYYLVRKYYDNGTELREPEYESGPYKTREAAEIARVTHWLHNNCYAVVQNTIGVSEV